MSIIDLLHNLLKEKLPSIHATCLQALMAAVQGGLKGASVSITQLGRSLSGPEVCVQACGVQSPPGRGMQRQHQTNHPVIMCDETLIDV